MSRSYIWRSIILIIVIIVSLICALYLQKYKLFRKSIYEGLDEGFGQTTDTSGNEVGAGKANLVPNAELIAAINDKIAALITETEELKIKNTALESDIKTVKGDITVTQQDIDKNTETLTLKTKRILDLKNDLAKAKAAEEAAATELSNRKSKVSSIMEASKQKSQNSTNALKLLPKMNFNNPSNLAACYSVRQVVPSYTGPVVQLRRSSDGNLQDIYSNGKQYNSNGTKWTTAARGLGARFVDWLGSSTAYVSKWYDQSPNGNHAVNNNHDESQPFITSQYGHWVIQFQSGNNTFLNIPKKIGANTIFTELVFNNNLAILGASNIAEGNAFTNKIQNAKITTYINNSGKPNTDLMGFYDSISTISRKTLNTVSVMSDTSTEAYIDKIGQVMNFAWFDGFVADIILHNTPMTGQDATDYFNNRLLV